MSDRAINKLAGVIVSIGLIMGLGQIATAQMVDAESSGDCPSGTQTCEHTRYFGNGAMAL